MALDQSVRLNVLLIPKHYPLSYFIFILLNDYVHDENDHDLHVILKY